MGRPLLPTLRETKRYITYNVLNTNTDIGKELRQQLGNINYAQSGIQFPKKNIIRCKANSLNKTKAALCLIKNQIIIKKISGAIKG